MSTVLFLSNIPLANPRRGTPQHLCYMLRQFRREHSLVICAASVPQDLAQHFIPYPSGRGWNKLRALKRMVAERGITHIFTAGQTGLLAPVLLKYLCGVKIAEELHGLDFEEFYAKGSIGLLRYWFMRCKVWVLLHFYDTVFVMSQKLIRYYAPMSAPWVFVQGGVDIHEIPDASKRTGGEKIFTIGYMGNARAYQGLPFLIEAAAVLKTRRVPFRLLLIISGDTGEVRELLASRGLSEVTTIHNDVSHEEAFRLIGDASVLVIPRQSSAITEYAFPGKLAEYMATGIPTVATEIGPIGEMREEFSQYCVLIRPDRIVENLAEALEKMQKMSGEERRALGHRARAYAGERFSWDARGKIFNERFRT